ncbi:MAG: DNA polymerase III subunit beta [Candidatus Lloydbacteria bacterium RIFCSPHIGHO2_02_FULL_51_22]|uniref:Beta sliding clamp n=1 Tax=Candidatus Lloydbacteria bacterium RIFCSPHIGHO2_02_FULL_51_22 TaxID=1798663 RepID=A0A1G2DBE6_9BACT|nr:MAG: DNA polymerase III subunit beta [Candidatus Lloydbacteria bacterium RIFCSPHIGHO2_02_FULL_51_22]
MKLQCIKEKIRDAVSVAERITNKNLSLPVLGSVLLSADKNYLKIIATNLDLGVEIKIPAKIEKAGVIAVPGTILGHFLSSITDETVFFDVTEGNLFISTKNNSTTIKSYPSEDFPTLPVVDKSSQITLFAKKLSDGLKSVWYSAGTSDIKPEISCVCVSITENTLLFTATDSFRLAEKKIQTTNKGETLTLLIPYKNALEITKILETVQGDVEVSFNKNQISFKYDSCYITSRLIDGVFPDYKQIIPKNFKTEVIVLKHDFLNSLKITNLFSDKFNQVVFTVNPSKKIFEVTAKNADIGEHKTFMETALSGDPVTLQFNQKYITDCLQSIATESLSLQMNGEGKPLVIRGIGDQSFLYLVMPLNQ